MSNKKHSGQGGAISVRQDCQSALSSAESGDLKLLKQLIVKLDQGGLRFKGQKVIFDRPSIIDLLTQSYSKTTNYDPYLLKQKVTELVELASIEIDHDNDHE